jgi:hypothetical protein
MIRRALISMLAVSAAALAVAAGAGAYWSASGAGPGLAATGSLAQVDSVGASVANTVAATTFAVTWSPLPVPPGAGVVYAVTRHAATDTVVCTTTAAACTLTGVPNGKATYTVSAHVNGWAGPESDPPVSVKVSTIAPTITSAPASGTAQTTASFTFTHPAFHTFRCLLDGGAPADCPGSAAYAGLATGTHTFQVQAADADGVLTAAATWTWTIA